MSRRNGRAAMLTCICAIVPAVATKRAPNRPASSPAASTPRSPARPVAEDYAILLPDEPELLRHRRTLQRFFIAVTESTASRRQ